MSTTIRIGTRDSKLALQQAALVENLFKSKGTKTELIRIKAQADIDLTTPLHQFGRMGIFTKVLDEALYSKQVDIAVHSLKDYPTKLPMGIELPAVLERGSPEDILVYKVSIEFLNNPDLSATIATGSIRRIAQWKSRYPYHQLSDLRGNVQTRLKKLEDHNWQGAIFAKAGLERTGLLPKNHLVLNWMIPAPAQGIIALTCRSDDRELIETLKEANHQKTFSEARIERQFLNTVEGGCSAPVGAKADITSQKIILRAGIFNLNGEDKTTIQTTYRLDEINFVGKKAADYVLANGGREIMEKIRHV